MKIAEKRLRRLLFLLPFVNRQPRGVPLAELARMLDTSAGQLRRDVEGIRFAGVPGGEAWQQLNLDVTGPAGEERLVVNVAGPLSRPPRLTAEEAYALLLGAAAVKGRGHVRFDEALARAERKLRRLLRGSLPAIEREARVAILSGRERTDIVRTIMAAQEKSLTLELDYASLGRGARRTLRYQPYGLFNHHGFFYVVGRSLAHDEVRVLKVERIRAARVLARRFARPADFDVRTYVRADVFAGGGGSLPIRLRLRGLAATTLAPTFEKRRKQRDGSVIVSFTGHASESLIGWLLRAGSEVEVLEPAALRDRLSQVAGAVLGDHG